MNFLALFQGIAICAYLILRAIPAAIAFEPCAGCPPLVVVGPGSFVMGDDGHATERPAHRVTIDRAFAIGRYEVTFDEWRRCVDDGACKGGIDDHGWGRGRRPIINVSWHDAIGFARWVSAKSGLACRLPGEAEWEFAARAGTTTAFWWGDGVAEGMANCRGCAAGQPRYGSVEVGTFHANPWGLYDTSGNVWEWTDDCWTPSHDGAAGTRGADCRRRVMKGGAWYYYHPNARASARAGNDARGGSYTIGFRLLCDLER